MMPRVLILAFLAILAGCGGGGMVKATSGLDQGFDNLGCLSKNFKGEADCKPPSG